MVLIKYNNVPGNVKLLLKIKKIKNQVNTDKSVFAQILVCWITHADKQMPEYKIGAAVGRVYIDIQTVAAEGEKKKPKKLAPSLRCTTTMHKHKQPFKNAYMLRGPGSSERGGGKSR